LRTRALSRTIFLGRFLDFRGVDFLVGTVSSGLYVGG
jgi:hypothetical protein